MMSIAGEAWRSRHFRMGQKRNANKLPLEPTNGDFFLIISFEWDMTDEFQNLEMFWNASDKIVYGAELFDAACLAAQCWGAGKPWIGRKASRTITEFGES